jgi:hypothetical protein
MDRYLPKRDKFTVAMGLTTTFFAIILKGSGTELAFHSL